MGDITTNFSWSEFSCKECQPNVPVPSKYRDNTKKLANNLQTLRDKLNKEIRINCGYRTPEVNARFSGRAQGSQHLVGTAADIHVLGMTSTDLYNKIEQLIEQGEMDQGGLGWYPHFVHYDVRGSKARWGHASSKTKS